MKKILVTGCAGFIGAHLCKQILQSKEDIWILGMDNLNSYYSVQLKEERLNGLEKYQNFKFVKGNIEDKGFIQALFQIYNFDIVVHLAAQAGVRYSITNPDAYVDSNLKGFFNILEACRHSYDEKNKEYQGVQHLVYASSSSVYGSNKKVPYSTSDKVDNPVSLYAATKKSNELMAYAYAKLYGIPSTGLRFFTVYGPQGRPDMAYFKFTNKITAGEPIQIYNHGDMYRDFTYIDDIVHGIRKVMEKAPDLDENNVPYKIYNIGNNKPESLLYFVETLEKILLQEKVITEPVKKEFLPMQPGDVYQTYADIDDLMKDFGFKPKTSLEEGLHSFVKWYKEEYLRC
ncbi:MAG: GDP-mannose 4,6-dehydratase [Lachnospiraceae bacterium]|nr:GDP-mannose 4,6-dehydratase [Lachnospiraceae bacterium]